MPNFPHDSLARAKVEAAEKWRDIEIPPLRFPEGWEIKLVAPFAGAVARFIATNTHGGKVSVYYDAHGALGACDSPYWEAYPVGGATVADVVDPERFFGEDTTDLIEFIAKVGDPVRGAVVGLGGEVDE
jgi:hypothetical protein